MFKLVSILASILLVFSMSLISAQEVVRDETFVPVSSAQAGSEEQGCMVACMTSMLASLNDPRIGTNPDPIIKKLRARLANSGENFPYSSYYVMNAVAHFLNAVL